MQYSPYNFRERYRAFYEAASLVGPAAGLQGVGAIVSAISTLAGGSSARTLGDLKSAQYEQNASGAIAGAQRRMFDTQQKTRYAQGSLLARAGTAGVDPGVGTPAELSKEIAGRGEYQGLMDMWSGQNDASGLRNQAAFTRYQAEEEERASRLKAFGTLASGMGSAFGSYATLSRLQKPDQPATGGPW